MAVLFIEGFDKYLQYASNPSNFVGVLLTQGEWTSYTTNNNVNTTTTLNMANPLSSTGYALQMTSGNITAQSGITKTLAANYSRLICGFRFSLSSISSSPTGGPGISFSDGGTAQCSVTFNAAGTISVRTGSINGTVIATSSASIGTNSTHYLEVDITFGSSANYVVYLDGVQIISGTGATKTTGNSYANGFTMGSGYQNATLTVNSLIIDDLYLFDTTGTTNNAVLLTSPRVETQYPTGDSSVGFTVGNTQLGPSYNYTLNANAPAANLLFLLPFTPKCNFNLQGVTIFPTTTASGAHVKSVCYSDSGGSPGTLLGTGAQVTGVTVDNAVVSAFGSTIALTSGTQYWLGFIIDTSFTVQLVDNSTPGVSVSNTYSSGAPATAPAMSTGKPRWNLWGYGPGASKNYTQENFQPATGGTLNYASSVGVTDLYSFPALTSVPAGIYTVAVKAFVEKSDTGIRTVSMEVSSAGTTGTGSNSNQSLSTSFVWQDSYFDTDPHTGAAWSQAALNAASSGVTVAT